MYRFSYGLLLDRIIHKTSLQLGLHVCVCDWGGRVCGGAWGEGVLRLKNKNSLFIFIDSIYWAGEQVR